MGGHTFAGVLRLMGPAFLVSVSFSADWYVDWGGIGLGVGCCWVD